MGNYNSQYESYYSTMVNKRKNNKGYKYNSNSSRSPLGFKLDKSFFLRRLIQDLIGVFLLFTFVIVCELVVTTQTEAAYNFSKQVINKNYDLTDAAASLKKLEFKDVEDKVTSLIEGIKVKFTGTQSVKDKIKSQFVLPINGITTSQLWGKTDSVNGGKEVHEGIDISAKVGTDVICPYEGEVKKCGEDGQLGKYILIDHKNGIETKYGQLGVVSVKVGDVLKKGQVIAKSGNTGESEEPHLHFELLIMGVNKDPEEYLNFNKS